MRSLISAFAAGLLFGAGLLLSGMNDPALVLAFFDLAGDWNPALGLVMAGALPVAALGWRLSARRDRPVCEARFALPGRGHVDRPLMAGAVLFGVGWGLVGLCPGPAIVNLTTGRADIALFVVAMLAGLWGVRSWRHRVSVAAGGFAR